MGSEISDAVSMRLHRGGVSHQQVLELRYFADYGHGFLGLFRALLDGNLEEVIRDPGPPYVDEKHLPTIMRTLTWITHGSSYRNKIPKKYAHLMEDVEEKTVSLDNLFC